MARLSVSKSGQLVTSCIGSFVTSNILLAFTSSYSVFYAPKSITLGILTRALLGLVRPLPSAGGGGGVAPPPIYLGNQQT